MRIGKNPQSKKAHNNNFTHQVVIPVFVPNNEGYFKDGFKILKISLASLILTKYQKTFITVVNNGSSLEVTNYLNTLFKNGDIHELVNTNNIGKNNAIIKGITGHQFKIITITDADVFFLNNWQTQTISVFNSFPKAAVVGLVPQFKMYTNFCTNVILDNLFSKKLSFTKVKNPEALVAFYKSLGWKDNYNKEYLKYNLSIEAKNKIRALVGSGHFVATYKREALNVNANVTINEKLSPKFDKELLDKPVLKIDGWRLTTQNNYAYHLGNVYENWMDKALENLVKNKDLDYKIENFKELKPISKLLYFIKNKLFSKVFSNTYFNKWFLKTKGLKTETIKDY